jgi:hypothetical protein
MEDFTSKPITSAYREIFENQEISEDLAIFQIYFTRMSKYKT